MIDTTKLRDLLKNYIPGNQQETDDYKIFLERAENQINLTRDSDAHFTASSFVINQGHTKVLAIFHNIYQSWGWMGGHADGDPDLLHVAKKEAWEESGITNLKLLRPAPISIESIPVLAHVRRGVPVPEHTHLNITFLFEADDSQDIRIEPSGNSGVKWIPLEELVTTSLEPHMQVIYQKIIDRIQDREKNETL